MATWNVRHRVQAENHSGAVAARWPQEPARIAAVTASLKARSEQVIALQELKSGSGNVWDTTGQAIHS